MNYKLAFANLLVTMAMYMQLPLLPEWLVGVCGFTHAQVAVAMGAYGVGLFALGCFCSYLVQKYRRNVVCIMSVLAVAACMYAFLYFCGQGLLLKYALVSILVLRFVQGAVFGLAQMVLSSTLIIDACQSYRRTEANHNAAWFSRFALSLGPLLAVFSMERWGEGTAMLIGVALCLLAAFLIMMVRFPFKAPEDVMHHVSLDRFFLPQGKWLFVNLLLVSLAVGLLLSVRHSIVFYAMLVPGFVLALLAERLVFKSAEPENEVITGLLLLFVALLMVLFGGYVASRVVSPVVIGCGVGLVAARFLLFFIKLSPHCRRGTSQSTYFLAWELGLCLGFSLGVGCFSGSLVGAISLSEVLIFGALSLFLAFTRKWYARHRTDEHVFIR